MQTLLYSLIFISFKCIIIKCGNYILNFSYVGNTFFDDFYFVDGVSDKSFSNFMNKSEATSMGMINTTSSTAYIGTDYTNIVGSEGRPSICLKSYPTWSSGLFILNASHMPTGCGTWPAFWLLTKHSTGEIDIIEGINLRTDDQSTVHTTTLCDYSSVASTLNMTGKMIYTNCTLGADDGGCAIIPNDNTSYGTGFNNNGGGIYATELSDTGIKIWFWTMSKPLAIPKDIYDKKPNPNEWDLPYAYFPFVDTVCNNVSADFYNMDIRLDLFYCGYAGTAYYWDEKCLETTKNVSCEQWVANNPQYFKDAYWLLNYIDVYQMTY
eukprot:160877_1